MSSCHICGRSGRGFQVRLGTFHEAFCCMEHMDAAYIVLKRGGKPDIEFAWPIALEHAVSDFNNHVRVHGNDLSQYSKDLAFNMVLSILANWQTSCYDQFMNKYELAHDVGTKIKDNNSTDIQYAQDALKAAGTYMKSLPTMDVSQWTDEQKQRFVYTIVKKVRDEADQEIPF